MLSQRKPVPKLLTRVFCKQQGSSNLHASHQWGGIFSRNQFYIVLKEHPLCFILILQVLAYISEAQMFGCASSSSDTSLETIPLTSSKMKRYEVTLDSHMKSGVSHFYCLLRKHLCKSQRACRDVSGPFFTFLGKI